MVKAAQLAATQQGRPAAPANGDGNGDGQQAGPMIPFVGGSRGRVEPFHDLTRTLQASSTRTVSSEDIVAIGYLAWIELLVEATGGDGSTTSAVANEDAPWNVLDRLQIADVNGNSILAPTSGFNHYLLQKYGANVHWVSDPRMLPSFSDVDSDGNFTFKLTVPVVISPRDMLGVLPNKNASQTYKLSYVINSADNVYDTQPAPTLPDVRVRGWLTVRVEPSETAVTGQRQAIEPPAVGTTQYLTESIFNLNGGQQTLESRRVGNIIRTLIAVLRNDSDARTTTGFPSDPRWEIDGNLLEQMHRDVLRDRMAAQYGLTGTVDSAEGLDTGVFVWSFAADQDGRPGHEARHEYLHTTSATRLQLSGEFGSSASTLSLLTQDIAVPAGA